MNHRRDFVAAVRDATTPQVALHAPTGPKQPPCAPPPFWAPSASLHGHAVVSPQPRYCDGPYLLFGRPLPPLCERLRGQGAMESVERDRQTDGRFPVAMESVGRARGRSRCACAGCLGALLCVCRGAGAGSARAGAGRPAAADRAAADVGPPARGGAGVGGQEGARAWAPEEGREGDAGRRVHLVCPSARQPVWLRQRPCQRRRLRGCVGHRSSFPNWLFCKLAKRKSLKGNFFGVILLEKQFEECVEYCEN
jgi:hypothetical protein